jgi:hypothetical protein
MMKQLSVLSLLAASLGGAGAAQSFDKWHTTHVLVATASNAAANELLVYDTKGGLLKTIPTQGQGGVSGNAGGIAVTDHRLAVVNYGSGNVTIFARDADQRLFHVEQLLQTLANPVSLAFGEDHLYVLSTTHVESHAIGASGIEAVADGSAALRKADGSAAQVGVLDGQLILTEKSNAIETVNLDWRGAIAGHAELVSNIPANVNAPFGLATRDNDAYVTIAHANEISLVRDNSVLTVTGSGTQHAPCWLTLDGPFLFSANSPSKTVSRYAVYGRHIVQDAAVVAQFNGDPTDIAYAHGLAAVVDSNGTVSHVSIFNVDEDGNLTLRGVATQGAPTTNGIAVLERHD